MSITWRSQQRTPRTTPLHLEAFWEKLTATPPLTWDKWTQQWKLALLAKEGIQLDTL